MEIEDFLKLTAMERDTLIISMLIRNQMEDFHCKNLSDEQMKELNPIIRKAVLRALLLLNENTFSDDAGKNEQGTYLLFLLKMIPNYWELFSEEELRKTLFKDI